MMLARIYVNAWLLYRGSKRRLVPNNALRTAVVLYNRDVFRTFWTKKRQTEVHCLNAARMLLPRPVDRTMAS